MPESFGVTSSGEDPSLSNCNDDQSTYGQNIYTSRPPTFSGDSVEFE